MTDWRAGADASRFQSWIRRRQYPDDCRVTVGTLTGQQYFHALGLGAQMVSLKFNLASALLRGRVYHFPTSHYVNPQRCASRSFDCYFERPTNCSTAEASGASTYFRKHAMHLHSESAKIHWCFDLPRRRLSRLAGLRGVHSLSWYHAQLAAFLFRPNAALVAVGRTMLSGMEQINRSQDGGGHVRRLLGGGTNSSCVAMHVRRTDKHTEDHRTASRSFADFGTVFKEWAHWEYAGQPAKIRVFLGSEDKTTFSEMPLVLKPFGAFWIPSFHFVMDMSVGKKFVDIKQGNARLGQLYDVFEAESKAQPERGATRTATQGETLMKDEGMALVAQIILMSGCEAMVGSYASNVAILVHDLMYARRVARGVPLHALDVNGRVYCGCGASFCMQAERKAAREPTQSIKRIVDGFKDPGR